MGAGAFRHTDRDGQKGEIMNDVIAMQLLSALMVYEAPHGPPSNSANSQGGAMTLK